MTWEEKFQAIISLSPGASLMMRKPGNWFVWSPGADVGGDGVWFGCYGNGTDPQSAVEDHWLKWTALSENRYIVVSTISGSRRLRWNGFMWADVPR